jgi:hypothetical protein
VKNTNNVMMFDQEDINQIKNRGITMPVIQKQIDHFITGFPFIDLVRPATPGDGILSFDDSRQDSYIAHFDRELPGLRVVKFVPASGAASRMFKHLFEFREKFAAQNPVDLQLKDAGFDSVSYFLSNLRQIAFYNDLAECMRANALSIDEIIENKEYTTIIDYTLDAVGLNYANMPKALLKFHQYNNGARTAAEEHMIEASVYARDRNKTARIHFTISPEHHEKFLELVHRVRESYASKLDVNFDISFSVQKPSTDTLAVDESNQPFRNPDGTLLFRPGGHGALLENLNDVDADLVFIKNIDNIVPDRLKESTFHYKKLLGGYLLSLREKITKYLVRLRKNMVTPEELPEIIRFSKEELFLDIPLNLQSSPAETQCRVLFALLNRPLRVCGMVKNEGEPGGGPFWVKGSDDTLSLQIVEASQVDLKNVGQKAILAASTHFNPVDLVCCTRDFEGNRFRLQNFTDEETGFISLKSSGGKTLKAQELPGLWNGSMAKWITIFIEVPVITFNPVKTVNDLLRREHLK